MPYDAMHRKLFNAITDAIKLLQAAQVETEELHISQEEPNITLLRPEDDGDE